MKRGRWQRVGLIASSGFHDGAPKPSRTVSFPNRQCHFVSCCCCSSSSSPSSCHSSSSSPLLPIVLPVIVEMAIDRYCTHGRQDVWNVSSCIRLPSVSSVSSRANPRIGRTPPPSLFHGELEHTYQSP